MSYVVDKFGIKFWNDSFYASVIFPDGARQELKSDVDLTYAGWQEKISAAWDVIQNPPVIPDEVDLIAATTEEIAAEIKKRGLTAADLGLATEPTGEVIR